MPVPREDILRKEGVPEIFRPHKSEEIVRREEVGNLPLLPKPLPSLELCRRDTEDPKRNLGNHR